MPLPRRESFEPSEKVPMIEPEYTRFLSAIQTLAPLKHVKQEDYPGTVTLASSRLHGVGDALHVFLRARGNPENFALKGEPYKIGLVYDRVVQLPRESHQSHVTGSRLPDNDFVEFAVKYHNETYTLRMPFQTQLAQAAPESTTASFDREGVSARYFPLDYPDNPTMSKGYFAVAREISIAVVGTLATQPITTFDRLPPLDRVAVPPPYEPPFKPQAD